MTSISRTLRIALLASVFFILVPGSSPLTTAAGKNRFAKRTETKRAVTPKAGKGSTQRQKNISARENRVDNRRRVSDAKAPLDSRSARLSTQRRLEQKRLEAKRIAERMAYVRAVENQRARDEALRGQVQSMIAKDDLTGEDLEVRRAAVGALGNHAGTVVVMNPQTGQVYSMVNQQWALREGFKPCSTIKLVTGLAGLNENVIDLNDTTKVSDNNQVNLTRALAYSKNEYFQQVGGQVGFDKMVSYARRLGLGEKTGINALNEFEGSVPGPASRFAMNRMWSHGDNFEVTPIQLATLVSAMANGGKLLTPHIARTKQEVFAAKTKVRRQVKMDTATWRNMVPGMVGAVVYGSGRRAFDPSETVAGKTGTCVEQGTWVGLFTSYAPLANPRLAVVVIARGADAHNHFPAAVAGRIYRDLNGRFGTPANLQVATTRKLSTPTQDVEPDDEEESESTTSVRKNWKEATNMGGISPARRTANSVTTASTSERLTKSAPPAVFKTTAPTNKVVPVLMQIPRRTPVIVKPAAGSTVTPSNSSESEIRPRRVFGER